MLEGGHHIEKRLVLIFESFKVNKFYQLRRVKTEQAPLGDLLKRHFRKAEEKAFHKALDFFLGFEMHSRRAQ